MTTGTPSSDVNMYEQYLEEIPRYTTFLTPAEHDRRSRQLAADHDSVDLHVIGQSREENDLLCLDIGEGDQTALMFGSPHPNEPIGSMMLDFLSELLATDDEFREGLDWQFLLIKCIDYDSTQLNTGWFDGAYTISNYATNFYRPPSHEQVEWTFPIEYETLSFDDPLPETQALMDLIAAERPDFIYSLHNAAFGGCYYYLSHPVKQAYEPLREISRRRDVPLDLGEPEAPYMAELDDAIWKMPTIKQRYDYLSEHIEGDPAEAITGGTGSLDYARRYNEDVVTLVTELPYFYDPRVQDDSGVGRSRREVVLEGTDRVEDIVEVLAEEYERVADDLTESKFSRSVEHLITRSRDSIAAQRSWAETDIPADEKATQGQAFDALTISGYYRLLYYGIMLRAIDRTTTAADKPPKNLLTARDRIEREFHDRLGTLLDELDYRTIPIWKLVAIQFQAGMIVMEQMTDH